MSYTRITIRPDQMGGVPCIRNLRIPVSMIVGMTAEGMTNTELLQLYPDLEAADIEETLLFTVESNK